MVGRATVCGDNPRRGTTEAAERKAKKEKRTIEEDGKGRSSIANARPRRGRADRDT